ncbi:hypothetical protein PanWU01x14_152880 [Parasponia andersonii]|uniref:Uncharacterized protein n=1 Tax=Parasponia andersonii TaxID=3476 RepID=A0A2P5CHH2_PARAD|nr:hypothetical protein PanWU01x14_152880 [Parasponia andersonii]
MWTGVKGGTRDLTTIMARESQPLTSLEGIEREILHWFRSREIVGIGEIGSTNPMKLLMECLLGQVTRSWKALVMRTYMEELLYLEQATKTFTYRKPWEN